MNQTLSAVAASTPSNDTARVSRIYAWVVFALTFGLMLSDYLSRQVIGAVFPFLKAEWGLSDSQLGIPVSVVSLVVGLSSVPISLISDRGKGQEHHGDGARVVPGDRCLRPRAKLCTVAVGAVVCPDGNRRGDTGPCGGLKRRATIFTVIGVSTLSTIAMVIYPIIVTALGLTSEQAGTFLGGTIHDVPQVVGAGFSMSRETGDVATIVKLLRVAMLLPSPSTAPA